MNFKDLKCNKSSDLESKKQEISRKCNVLAKHKLGISIPHPLKNYDGFCVATMGVIKRAFKVDDKQAKEWLDRGIRREEKKLSSKTKIINKVEEVELAWQALDEQCQLLAECSFGLRECDNYEEEYNTALELASKVIYPQYAHILVKNKYNGFRKRMEVKEAV